MKKNKSLIPIEDKTIGQSEVQTVNARRLHNLLGVKRDFSDWIKKRINDGRFQEGRDYVLLARFGEQTEVLLPQKKEQKGSGGHNIIEYFLTVYMAKHLSMLERNDKGYEARDYFIKREEEYRSLQDRIFRTKLRNLEDPARMQTRQDGKLARREETDILKQFVEYAKSQGSQNADRYYSNITKMTYKSLGFIEKSMPKENVRELIDRLGLMNLSAAELLVAKTIKTEMEAGTHYKEIYQRCKAKLESFADLVGKQLMVA